MDDAKVRLNTVDLSQSSDTQEDVPETAEEIYHDLLTLSAPKSQGCGKFQIFIFILMLNAITASDYVFFDIAYLELMPQFNCVINGTLVMSCS
jgi:hypothetical protein